MLLSDIDDQQRADCSCSTAPPAGQQKNETGTEACGRQYSDRTASSKQSFPVPVCARDVQKFTSQSKETH